MRTLMRRAANGFRWRQGVAVAAAIAAALWLPLAARAETHEVSSIEALKSRLYRAVAGDVIRVKDGVYTTTGTLTLRAAGTAEQPITVMAETTSGVEIVGTHGFNIVEPAAHVVIAGFVFKHAAGKNTIGAGTQHVRFTRNVFACTGDGAYLSVAGDDAQIDYNEFRDKTTAGSMVAVGGSGNQVARRVWIHYNHFRDFAGVLTGSAEMIRLGLSAHASSIGAARVEHNLFARCRGENELISNRSSGNTYRYNTFIDSPTAQVTMRHGNDCVVTGNYFFNTEGLRLFGDRHLVHSNYFERNYIGINLGNGNTDGPGDGAAAGHDRPDNCVIVFNTLVANRTHYQLSRRTPDALGATNTIFANNVIVDGGTAAKIEGPYAGAVWQGNWTWNVQAGDLPAAGVRSGNPGLVASADGIRRPANDSPLRAAAEGDFPAITEDIEGQPRGEQKSVGADEASDAPRLGRVLGAEDVGPAAK